MKYLDPKNDLTFRKIFGEHPHLLISFLNAMLPLEEGREIKSLEYQDNEIIPELPGFKRSLVDVRCIDNHGRIFIVEMQMYWTSSFKSRMLFNSGKAYIKQLKKGKKYTNLHPVYGLSLVNENFQTDEELKEVYYHHYRMGHIGHTSEYIKGIELIFVELQKFKSIKFAEKRLRVLWLRFLTEIDEETEKVPEEFLKENVIKEALETVQESAFTEKELEYYEKYWDSIRIEETALEDVRKELARTKQKAEQEHKEKQAAKQKEQEAKQKEQEAIIKLAQKMKKYGEPINRIMEETGLSKKEIEKL